MGRNFKKYLITYDIKDNRRRTKVAAILEGFGERVQYSVFECLIKENKINWLIEKLKNAISIEDEDNIRIYPIDKISKEEIIEIGKPKDVTAERLIII